MMALLYEMIMFCRSYRQLAGAIWLSFYCMNCNHHVIALLYHYALAIVVEAIVGETTQRYNGDQGVKPVMMVIMTVLWRWRSKAQDDDGHIISLILLACDVYPLCILFCLVRR